MSEQIFQLITVQPKSFFGVNNCHIRILENNFPNLKIIARDNLIRVYGSKCNISIFTDTFNKLIACFEQKNTLSQREFSEVIHHRLSAKDMLKHRASENILLYGDKGKPIKYKTQNQKKLVDSIMKNDMVFALGPAGTGKTYTSVALAVKALKEKQVKRIILTRPAVEAGENLGFLPGDIKEKLDPYMLPIYDALNDMISAEKLKEYIEDRIIEIAPLAFMRGRTIDNAFVILDEAQNTTSMQMKMFLTRMGHSAKFIITGDPGQIDLPPKIKSGLIKSVELLSNIEGIEIIYLSGKDIIRHPIVKKVVEAYKNLK